MEVYILLGVILVICLLISVVYMINRYHRCPPDQILVVFGSSLGGKRSAKCYTGGGAFVLPIFQDYRYLSLKPMTISIPLQNALSKQNIRINVPATFTVGISTDEGVMNNAAERLLNIDINQVDDLAKEIIFGQLRLTVASLTIEEINQDRQLFLAEVQKNVEPELKKIGLKLINVNITDITDSSNYIESIGKKAAAEAVERAKIDVAEQVKLGAIGESAANKEKAIEVAKNQAEADKGQKEAEADKRIFVQKKEAEAVIGEADANSRKLIEVSKKNAEADKGQKDAEADKRIYIQEKEAEAVEGENKAKAAIVLSNSQLYIAQAEAEKNTEIARKNSQTEINKAQYFAELERLKAQEIVNKEIEKRKIELDAQAEAARISTEAQGQADALLKKYEAEAEGIRKVLEAKANGYAELLKSVNGDAKALSTLLMVEKIETIVMTYVVTNNAVKYDDSDKNK